MRFAGDFDAAAPPAPFRPMVTWRSVAWERVRLSRDRHKDRWLAATDGRWATGDTIEEAVDAVNPMYFTRAP